MLRILLMANLASSGAYILLNLVLAQQQHASTGSAFAASAIIFAAYVPQLLVAARLGAFVDRTLCRSNLLACECLAAGISLVGWLGLAVGAPSCVFLLVVAVRLGGHDRRAVFIREVAEAHLAGTRAGASNANVRGQRADLADPGGRVGRARLSRRDGPPYLRSGGRRGALRRLHGLITQLAEKPQRAEIVVMPERGSGTATLRGTYSEIFREPALARHFVVVSLAQGLFQGFEQVVVSVGGNALARGGIGTAMLQVAGSAGLVAGVVLLWCRPQLLRAGAGRVAATAVAGLLSLVVVTQSASPAFAIPAFLVMTAAYELIDLNSTSLFFSSSPEAYTARYSLALSSFGGTLMRVEVL